MNAKSLMTLAILLATSLFDGCAFLHQEPARLYRLSMTLDEATTVALNQARGRVAIEVLPLNSNRPQGGSLGLLVAEVGEVTQVEEFAAGRWEEPPETAMGRAVATAVRPITRTEPTRRLRWSLDQFELVEPAGQTPYAGLALSLRLLSAPGLSAPGRVELAMAEIREHEPLPPNASLEQVVLAFDRAASRALSRVVGFILAASADH